MLPHADLDGAEQEKLDQIRFFFSQPVNHPLRGGIGPQQALQPLGGGGQVHAVALPDFLIEDVFELFAGGHGDQRQRVVRTDFPNEEVEILFRKRIYKSDRLRVIQYAFQRFFRRQG